VDLGTKKLKLLHVLLALSSPPDLQPNQDVIAMLAGKDIAFRKAASRKVSRGRRDLVKSMAKPNTTMKVDSHKQRRRGDQVLLSFTQAIEQGKLKTTKILISGDVFTLKLIIF
jgi:hypothetical protein